MDRYQLQKMIDAQPEAKLKDLVMQLLYDEIISLKLAPGTRLNVNQIASILGISRTPVAEAVTGLVESGFVVNRPEQAGSFVLELSLPDMISLYQVRNAIESEAAYLCAYNADEKTGQRHDARYPRHAGHGYAVSQADHRLLRKRLSQTLV